MVLSQMISQRARLFSDIVMPTVLEFLDDPYKAEAKALVMSAEDNRIVLDRTVFYPGIGVSPPDSGVLVFDDGRELVVSRSDWHRETPDVLEHFCVDDPGPEIAGEKVVARIDWRKRYATMRVHTALHLVSVAMPYPMVDGEIRKDGGHAVFELDETGLEARELAKIVDTLIARADNVEALWIAPSVPDRRTNIRPFDWPNSQALVRAIKIGDIDIQLCDGLHVRNTAELQGVEVRSLLRIAEKRFRCSISSGQSYER